MIQLVWTPPATFRVTFCSLAARAPGSNYGKTVIIELGRVRGSGLPEAGGDAAGGRGVISRDAGRHRDCTEGRLIFLHYCAPPNPFDHLVAPPSHTSVVLCLSRRDL